MKKNENHLLEIEELLKIAKKDIRVKCDFVINDKIHVFEAIGNINNKNVILYVHGLGSNKNWITRFYSKLLDNNYNVYSLDLIGHGEDNTSFEKFTLSNCIQYVKETIDYIKSNHKNCNIYLFGCSYGGFVLLNGYNEIIKDISKIYLMCPAINFCEILEKKMGNLNINYFSDHNFLPLYNNIKIYKKAYEGFKNGDNFIKNNKFNNVFIIQGDNDKTVLVDNIIDFSNKNNLVCKIIKGGKHELYGFDDNIIKFILNN